jgi:hypothetical protein
MSELPPQIDLPYEPNTYDNASMLVRLSFIFFYIVGGIDFLAVPFFIVYIFLFPMMLHASGPGGAPPPPAAVSYIVSATYGLCALISLLQGILKMIAATKLRRRSTGAWGWALAAGIAACLQLQCSFFCVLPLAAGVFTIVILCRENVRRYLREIPNPQTAP